MQREIKITVTPPEDCTDEQFKEWVEFNLNYRVGMSNNNPLWIYELDVDEIEFE